MSSSKRDPPRKKYRRPQLLTQRILLVPTGAASLYLFGSTNHNRAKPHGDIDIFSDPVTTRPFTLMELLRIRDYLTKELDAPVDLTTRSSLHPKLRGSIQASAVKVF